MGNREILKAKRSVTLSEMKTTVLTENDEPLVVEDSVTSLDNTYKVSNLNTETTITTLRFYKRNAIYTKVKALKERMSFQDYINLIIEQDKVAFPTRYIDPYKQELPEVETTITKSVVVTKDNLEYLKNASIQSGMKLKEYLNFILDDLRKQDSTIL